MSNITLYYFNKRRLYYTPTRKQLCNIRKKFRKNKITILNEYIENYSLVIDTLEECVLLNDTYEMLDNRSYVCFKNRKPEYKVVIDNNNLYTDKEKFLLHYKLQKI